MLTGFPAGASGKEPPANAGDRGDMGLIDDALEEGMATHSSILAWRISWAEEPGGLQSMGSQGVRHNWSDLAHTQVELEDHLCLVFELSLSGIVSPRCHHLLPSRIQF